MPADIPPHKPPGEDGWGGRDPGPEHRLRMCRLAVAGVAGLSVCALEIERGGLSYTVDTLKALHASHPDAELTLIVGADTASTLASWRQPAKLLELAHLAVAARAGAARRPVLDAIAGLGEDDEGGRQGRPGPVQSVRFLEMPTIEVSSSMVRRRVAEGEPIEELVGSAVAGYIAEHGLYRADAEATG